jgi:hypothetical protein
MTDLGDEAPGETAAQALFEAVQFRGQLVAGEHDLLVRVVKGVEGVEELVLRAVLSRKELDVVDQEYVRRLAIAAAELLHEIDRARLAGLPPLVEHRSDEAGDELLAGHHRDGPPGVLAVDLVPDGMEQVRLAETDAAENEERVVLRGGNLRDHTRGGMGELVGFSDHEVVEFVAGVEPLGLGRGRGDFSRLCRRNDFARGHLGCLLFPYFEKHRVGCLGATFEVREDRGQVMVFKPFLLVAVGRVQTDLAALEPHAADGTQPLITVRRPDSFLDRSYGLTPEC